MTGSHLRKVSVIMQTLASPIDGLIRFQYNKVRKKSKKRFLSPVGLKMNIGWDMF